MRVIREQREFIIDTVNPTVDITDDQDGTASDGEKPGRDHLHADL